jgi:transposase
MFRRPAHSRPLPYRRENEQGARRDPCRENAPHEHEGRDPVLKKSRWLLLKRSQNLGEEQHFRLRDLLRYNLKTVRAYLLKEAQQLWEYNSPTWAGKFLDE